MVTHSSNKLPRGTPLLPGERWKRAVLTVGKGRGFVIRGADGERRIVTSTTCLPALPPFERLGPKSSFHDIETARAYPRLVALLGEEPAVWARCEFFDPFSKLAVLGCPWGETFNSWMNPGDNALRWHPACNPDSAIEECRARGGYPALMARVKGVKSLTIGPLVSRKRNLVLPSGRQISNLLPEPAADSVIETVGWVLALDGQWLSCSVRRNTHTRYPDPGSCSIHAGNEYLAPGMAGSPILSLDGAAIGVITDGISATRSFALGRLLRSSLPNWVAAKPRRRRQTFASDRLATAN
jgi:hypothetical protein